MDSTKLFGQPTITPLSNTKINRVKFNDDFEQNIKDIKLQNIINEQKRIQELNNQIEKKTLFQNNIFEFHSGIKTTLFSIMDDILYKKKINMNNNKLFYLGIAFIYVSLFMIIYNVLIQLINE
jgi:hypothetical protein